MSTRLIHVSDLHLGSGHEPSAGDGLAALVAEIGPELVVATGDLTNRGRPDQHARAAAFLRGLGVPVLAVPGNHDLPYTLPARVTRPWARFEAVWETSEPVHATASLHVVGLNSVRPWRHQTGGLRPRALERAGARLREATPGALRVACLHHQLANAPWRTRKRPLARRAGAIAALAAAGAELVLSGHVHQASAAARHEFQVADGDPPTVVVTAPGLGRPRPHRLGEARGLHVISADAGALTVETRIESGGAWRVVATRSFPRGDA